LNLNDINSRIRYLIQYLEMNTNSFANKVGVAQAVIYNIVDEKGRKSKPSYELIVKIIKSFDINPAWLLINKGHMFHSEADGPSVLTDQDSKYKTDPPMTNDHSTDMPATDQAIGKDLQALKVEIEHLKEINTLLRQHNTDLRLILHQIEEGSFNIPNSEESENKQDPQT